MRFLQLIILITFLSGCESPNSQPNNLELNQKFKDYWYSGKAELTSYTLEQARYGEIRKGEAVLIYVSEDFLPAKQVKADAQDDKNIPILKLNSTKKFLTGIYPYSIMESSFYPLNGEQHALKVSASVQEWCGHVYMQLNNRNNFQITSHSYFQGEADSEVNLKRNHLENEIWNMLRIVPDSLPVGEFEMIPSFEYLRLHHKEIKAYTASGEYYTDEELNIYLLRYPQLKRELKIYYSRTFPYSIQKWEETAPSGFGENAQVLTTRATKNKQIRIDYWNKNSNNDLYLRDQLGLE